MLGVTLRWTNIPSRGGVGVGGGEGIEGWGRGGGRGGEGGEGRGGEGRGGEGRGGEGGVENTLRLTD